MVKIKGKKGKVWDYPHKKHESVLINDRIKTEFSIFCKKHKLNKSKLVEDFYTAILVRMREGSLNSTNKYITMRLAFK